LRVGAELFARFYSASGTLSDMAYRTPDPPPAGTGAKPEGVPMERAMELGWAGLTIVFVVLDGLATREVIPGDPSVMLNLALASLGMACVQAPLAIALRRVRARRIGRRAAHALRTVHILQRALRTHGGERSVLASSVRPVERPVPERESSDSLLPSRPPTDVSVLAACAAALTLGVAALFCA
jgi:hypothetical protein